MDVNRTRTIDRRTLSDRNETFTNIYTGITESGVVHPGISGAFTTITDVNHRGYNRRLKSGELMIGPMELSKQVREVIPASFSWVSYHTNYTQDGDLFPGTQAPVGGTYPVMDFNVQQKLDELADTAIVKLYTNLNGSTVAGGENLAELGKTIQMLKRPLASVQDLIFRWDRKTQRYITRNKLKLDAASVRDAYANTWLEVCYGMLPLVSDIQALMGAYSKGSSALQADRLVARAGAKSSHSATEALTGTQYGDYHVLNGMQVSINRTTTVSLRADAGVFYGFKNQNAEELILRTLGLRSSDMFVLAWDLTPLSFVADWFVGVGDWLRCAYLDPNLLILGSWVTKSMIITNTGSGTRTISRNRVSENGQQSELVTSSGGGGGERIITTSIKRQTPIILPAYPLVDLEFRSLRHAISGAALSIQRISGVFKKALG